MEICKACIMLEGLNRGLPKLGVGKSSKTMGKVQELQDSGEMTKGNAAPATKADKSKLDF